MGGAAAGPPAATKSNVDRPRRDAACKAAGNTPAASAAFGIVPAHCGPPTASGFHLCSVNLGSKKDRWRRATVTHAAGPLTVEAVCSVAYNKEPSSLDPPCRTAPQGAAGDT
jgi:hypothetical protein